MDIPLQSGYNEPTSKRGYDTMTTVPLKAKPVGIAFLAILILP